MREVLLVDGYNIIGDWPELRRLKAESLEAARDRLIDELKEYRAVTGRDVIVVFDAHLARGGQTEETLGGVRIYYSKEFETADELIERFVYELWQASRRRRIYVATSDYVEQQVTFGQGALRISARELRRLVEEAKRETRRRIEEMESRSNRLAHHLSPEVREMFEKWRRK
jgi:predicted RNA-binding protein with PIN domain